MPKGRGSNWRRRTRRQKYRLFIARLPNHHPWALDFEEARAKRMKGKRNPKNFVRKEWTGGSKRNTKD